MEIMELDGVPVRIETGVLAAAGAALAAGRSVQVTGLYSLGVPELTEYLARSHGVALVGCWQWSRGSEPAGPVVIQGPSYDVPLAEASAALQVAMRLDGERFGVFYVSGRTESSA